MPLVLLGGKKPQLNVTEALFCIERTFSHNETFYFFMRLWKVNFTTHQNLVSDLKLLKFKSVLFVHRFYALHTIHIVSKRLYRKS